MQPCFYTDSHYRLFKESSHSSMIEGVLVLISSFDWTKTTGNSRILSFPFCFLTLKRIFSKQHKVVSWRFDVIVNCVIINSRILLTQYWWIFFELMFHNKAKDNPYHYYSFPPSPDILMMTPWASLAPTNPNSGIPTVAQNKQLTWYRWIYLELK